MEQALKQRLIGAIVLVSLAVIFIPLILEGPDDDWTPRSHSIPEQPQMDYRADIELALPPETPGVDETVAMELMSQEQVESEPQPAVPVVKATAAPDKAPDPVKAAPKPAPPVKPVAPATPKTLPLQGWFVQVGSFGQEMNAKGLRDRLVAAGFHVQMQDVKLGSKHTYRVLVGPASSRTEAEKQAEKLQSGQHLRGMVIEYSS